MSFVMMLMIGGWVATLSMVGVCALKESGKLLLIRKRTALWLYSSVAAADSAPKTGLQRETANAR